MANQSIYSNKWIDLVFEDRNKEYGAYQLRQENPKTTLKALAIGCLLLTSIVSVPMLVNQFGTQPLEMGSTIPSITPYEMSSVVFPPEKKPETQAVAPLIQKKNNKAEPKVDKSNLIDPKVTEAQNATAVVAENSEAHDTYIEPIEGALSGAENSGVKGGTKKTLERSSDGDGNGTVITAILDKQPAFPGGMNNFYSYVAKNFRAPDAELSKTVKVFVSFVIEKDGTMTDITVVRNPGYGLDKEAIRVLKSLKTKWSPGILNGKPVRTSYNLPIIVERQ
jgi:protein TonB